jgi:isopenicillin N synthase-like dioxygenase
MLADSQIRALQTQGRIDVPYSQILRKKAEEAAMVWRSFVALPDAEKNALGYTPGMHGGCGYELKRGEGVSRDLKENINMTLESLPHFRNIAHERESLALVRLLQSTEALLLAVDPLIYSYAGRMQEVFHLPGFRDEVMKGKDKWFLRFLHYMSGADPGTQTAEAHADKSGFTLHLHESDKGLEFLDWRKNWQPMPVYPGKTVIIPGMQLQLRSNGSLKALWHRVVATETTAGTGRFSMVLFVPLVETPVFDKTRVGRMQDQVPGENYDIAPADFARLFADPVSQ